MACTLQVGLLLCVIGSVQISSAVDPPPVQRSQTVVLSCTGRSESRQRPSLHWWTTSLDNENVSQAICYSAEVYCRNVDSSRYVVNASFNDTHFNTSLTILKITQRELSLTYKCILYEKVKNWAYFVQSWNMSDIVYPPKKTTCKTVYKPEDSTVNILCSVSKVSTEIVCKLFQVDNFNELPLTNTKINYSYQESSTTGYRDAYCNLVTSLSKPGIFKFKVDLFPSLGINDLVNNTSAHVIYTNEVKVPGNPEVYIKPNHDCEKNNKTLRFLCTSRWLPHATNLVWFKNATLISNTTTNHSVDAGFYTSQSSIEIQNSPGVGSLRCQVNYMPGGSAPNKTVNAELLVDTFVPSVYFTYSGMPLKHLVIDDWKSLKTSECRVNDSNPVVNAVLVVCQTSKKVYNFSSTTRSVSFDIPRGTPKDTGICFCSASQCYSPKINFTFSFGYPAHSQSIFRRPRSESFINIVCYIVAGCFVFVFLVFFVATVMFLVHRWNKLYSYIYGKIYFQSQTQAKVMLNGGHQYYSVANPTTSDLLMARPDCHSLASENIVENGRTSASSSTNSLHAQHVYSNADVDSDEVYSHCNDLLTSLHPSPGEAYTYYNTTNGAVPITATIQAGTLFDVAQGKSSKLFQPVDLLVDKQQPFSNPSLPPKPCRLHRCPDLLLHRSSLYPQMSWSDEQSQSVYELPQQRL